MLRTELPQASACREPGVRQPPHRELHLVQLHEVELHVLARGDVAEAARPAFGDVGQGAELGDVQDALRDLDADHLHVALALAVRAAHQAERAPLVGRQLAALVALERGHELLDLGLARERQPRSAERADVG